MKRVGPQGTLEINPPTWSEMKWERILSFTSLYSQVNASNTANVNLKYSIKDRLNTKLYKTSKACIKVKLMFKRQLTQTTEKTMLLSA